MKKWILLFTTIVACLCEGNAQVIQIDSYDYDDLSIDRPTIICFYAEGCNASQSYLKVLERLSVRYEGIVDFYKVDAAEELDWFKTYGRGAVPLSIAIYSCDAQNNSVDYFLQVGYMPYYTAMNFIDDLIRRWNREH